MFEWAAVVFGRLGHHLRRQQLRNLTLFIMQFFYLEVEHYDSVSFPTARHQLHAAQHIYDTYVSSSSIFEVNIDQKVRRDILAHMKAASSGGDNNELLKPVFSKAKAAILQLMEGSYVKFAQSPMFVQMKRELGMYFLLSGKHYPHKSI